MEDLFKNATALIELFKILGKEISPEEYWRFPHEIIPCTICTETKELWYCPKCPTGLCTKCISGSILYSQFYPVRCSNCHTQISDHDCYKMLKKENHVQFSRQMQRHRLIRSGRLPCYNLQCMGTYDRPAAGSQVAPVKCDRCGVLNCVVCKAMHAPAQSCEDWCDNNANLLEARRQLFRTNVIKTNQNKGLFCPSCVGFFDVVAGCDNVFCPHCGEEICFRTKKKRWGPAGRGDTSDGCRCGVGGVKCHLDCQNCH